ncbi:hypothetical protein ABEY48_01075 [Bacillus mycoides]|uniref:hypothetical protein n=1 Tax=Bacillus mycoides TaxID=1405 RepID=UPI003D1DD935
MEIQTNQKGSKKAKLKKSKRLTLNADKINLVLYTIGGGIIGSALFAATTYGSQTVTNISTLIGGLGGGVISGFLTLQGVRRTIELQKEKEHEDSKPQKVRSIHVMKKLTEDYKLRITMLKGSISTISKDGNTEMLNEIMKYQDEKENDFEHFRDKMIEESLNVNRYVYLMVKENLKNISPEDLQLTAKIFAGKFHPTKDLKEGITFYIESILRKVLSIEKNLEKELTIYEDSLFSAEDDID